MTSEEGGWTLVASIHENNINGKCTIGDKWSSEQQNSEGYLGSKRHFATHNLNKKKKYIIYLLCL